MKKLVALFCLLLVSGHSLASSVYFEEHSDVLEEEELDKLESSLPNKNHGIVLRAFDNSEGPSFNSQVLRFARCAEVRAHLIERGFPAHKIQIEEGPLKCKGCSGKKARRVDLITQQ